MLLLLSRGGATQKLCVLIRHSIISSVFLISVGNRCTVTIEKDNESGQMSRSVTLEHTYCSFSVISGHVFLLWEPSTSCLRSPIPRKLRKVCFSPMALNDVSRAPKGANMINSGLCHTKTRTKYVLVGHLAMRSTFCLVKPYAK